MNERLKLLREFLNISQETLGEKINVTRSHISSIEKGKRTLTERIIHDICREYSVNEKWLRDGDGDMFVEPDTFSLDEYAKKHNLTSLELSIVKSYMELDEDLRQRIMLGLKSIFNKEKDSETAASIEDDINKNDDDIEKEVQTYRLEMEAMKKGTTSSALEKQNKNLG